MLAGGKTIALPDMQMVELLLRRGAGDARPKLLGQGITIVRVNLLQRQPMRPRERTSTQRSQVLVDGPIRDFERHEPRPRESEPQARPPLRNLLLQRPFGAGLADGEEESARVQCRQRAG